MRKIFLATIFFSLFFFVGARNVSPTFASGDLQIVSQNDVMYVSTQNATPSADATESAIISTTSAIARPIALPKGFFSDFGQLINSLLKVVLVVAALLVFAFLIWGGLQWITSGGEKSKTEAARNKIIAAIIGLIILAASYAILTLSLRFLGFTDLNDVINNAGTINGPSTTASASATASNSSQLRNLNLLK